MSTGLPLSLTRTVKLAVPVAVGVQLNRPVPALMAAPAGALSREKASVWPGLGSVAAAVKLRAWPTTAVWLPMGASTGAWLAGAGAPVLCQSSTPEKLASPPLVVSCTAPAAASVVVKGPSRVQVPAGPLL